MPCREMFVTSTPKCFAHGCLFIAGFPVLIFRFDVNVGIAATPASARVR